MPDKIVKYECIDGKTFNSFREAKMHEVEIKNFGIDLIDKLMNKTAGVVSTGISKEKSLLWNAMNENFYKEKAWQFCYELFLLIDKEEPIFEEEEMDLFKRIHEYSENKHYIDNVEAPLEKDLN